MNPKPSPQYDPIQLYRHAKAGQSHHAELMLAVLDLPYETVDVELAGGFHKAPAFLRLSPLGQVPVIEDNGDTLCDSNAILVYLARSSLPGKV